MSTLQLQTPSCKQDRDSFSAPERGTFYRAKSYDPNYGDWLLKVCRRVGFKPRIVKEADGAASALAFVAAGVWRGGGQRGAAEDTRQESGFPRSDSRGQRVGTSGGCLEAGRSIRSSRFSIC